MHTPRHRGRPTIAWTVVGMVTAITALSLLWPEETTDGPRVPPAVSVVSGGASESVDGTPVVACPHTHRGTATVPALAGVNVTCLG